MVCSVKSQLFEVYLINCHSLKSFNDNETDRISLRTLYVHECRSLELPPYSQLAKKFGCLQHLLIGSSCDSLTSLTLNIFPKLKTLSIWDFQNLVELSIMEEAPADLVFLESIEIRDCPNLTSFPKGGLPIPNLESLLFSNCKNLDHLPDSMNHLTSLKLLYIHQCPDLKPSSLRSMPSSLVLLSIAFCDKLIPQKDWGLHKLEALSHLEIEGGCMEMESFSEEMLFPCNIKSLNISTLQNLKKLDYQGLQHLKHLKSIVVSNFIPCHNLDCLPP